MGMERPNVSLPVVNDIEAPKAEAPRQTTTEVVREAAGDAMQEKGKDQVTAGAIELTIAGIGALAGADTKELAKRGAKKVAVGAVVHKAGGYVRPSEKPLEQAQSTETAAA
jgi:hypothetical protein